VDALIALSLLWKQLIQCTSSDECAIIHSLVPRYAFCPSARESVSSRTSTALTSDTYSDGFNEVKALGIVNGTASTADQARLIVGNRREQAELVGGMEPTGIKPVIDRSFPLKQLADAFHYEKSGHHFGKICLEV
jgi:NADPH:quinone reductase-like Zn-dependent oxidoreductase